MTTTQKRTWPLSAADTVILAIMLVTLAIGVSRFVVVVATLASGPATTAPSGVSSTDTGLSTAIAEGLKNDPTMAAWWGDRFIPRPKGDDYLKVLTERSTLRTLGPAIGTIIERTRAGGVSVTRVYVPEDNDALLGGKTGTTYKTAGGGETSTSWAPVGRSASNFTAVPFVSREYAPVLSDAHVASLESSTTLEIAARDIRIARPVTGGSGAWILYSHPTPRASEGREFLLVPVEIDPLGATP